MLAIILPFSENFLEKILKKILDRDGKPMAKRINPITIELMFVKHPSFMRSLISP